MEKIIEWCNLNNGFLTAILSMVGLLLSLTAIVVSVRTALLPFKKKIKISSFVSIAFSKNELTGEVHSEVVGLCVNAANVGFRNANLVYLGILVRHTQKLTCNTHYQKLNRMQRYFYTPLILKASNIGNIWVRQPLY